ncbi:CopY family transcriptional regulator [archaeon]|nr:MAG: CopY family transcriptional regulator [archaeon]
MFVWHEYRPFERGYRKILGPLETDIMEILWNEGTTTARGVYDILRDEKKNIRRSTISIMMNRLCERNLIEKNIEKGRGGLKYVYKVRVSRNDFEDEVVSKILTSLNDTFPGKVETHMRKLH